MSEKKYYVHATKRFADGTAYVERTGRTKVCVLDDGSRTNPSGWDRDHHEFVENGSWREITEDEAKSRVKVSATSSESTVEQA